jgi:RimJ/RimL family protein N-acetyltransferase
LKLCLDASIVGPWVAERTGGTWFEGRGTAIGKLNEEGDLVAGVLYEDWNGVNINEHIAAEGNWASKKFLWVMFHYPFCQLKVKRITAPVCSTNEKVIKLVEHMGFTLECRLSQATPRGDLLIYRMFKEECRYIRGRYEIK